MIYLKVMEGNSSWDFLVITVLNVNGLKSTLPCSAPQRLPIFAGFLRSGAALSLRVYTSGGTLCQGGQ